MSILLKDYNDTFGHLAGDKLLKTIGLLANNETRASDLVARYGGDEFAVTLPNTGKGSSKKLAQRIRRAVEKVPSLECSITVSIGVCSLNPKNIDTLTLIDKADHALYQAKQAGRNVVLHIDDCHTE